MSKTYTVDLTADQMKTLGLPTEESEFPLFQKWGQNQVVKFLSVEEIEVVWDTLTPSNIGSTYKTSVLITHPGWTPILYDRGRDLFDGQPVWCWDDESTHARTVRFYYAGNECTYSLWGDGGDHSFHNYEAVLPEHYTEWMMEAYKTLEQE